MANAFYAPMAKATQYAAPDISKLLYEGIGNLPQDYYTGQQNAQQLALMNMFPQGLAPYQNPDGSLKQGAYAKIANQAARIGGYNTGMPMLNNLLRMQQAQQDAPLMDVPTGGQPPAYSPTSASPSSNINPARTSGPQSSTAQPPEPSGGGEVFVNNIVSETLGGVDGGPKLPVLLARKLGVDPSQPLTEQQEATGRRLMQSDPQLSGLVTAARGASKADTDPASGPQATFGPSEESSGAPWTYSPGVSGSPGPSPEPPVGGPGPGVVTPQGIVPRSVPTSTYTTAALGRPTAQPRITITPAGAPAQPAPQIAQAQPAPQGSPLQPPAGYGQDRIRDLESGIARLMKQALYFENLPTTGPTAAQDAAQNKAAANGYRARAEQMQAERQELIKSMLERSQPTPPMKESMTQGAPEAIAAKAGMEEQSKKAGEAYAKLFDEKKEIADKASTERPKIALAKQWLNDPSMYTGPWSSHVLRAKQVLSALGGNPNAAVSQEAFNKAVQDLTLNIIQTLPPPVRVREMAIIQQAQAQSGITIPTNRLLLEMADRIYARGQDLYSIANKYGRAKIGPQFEQQEAQYWAEHPLFSREELRDPRRISPPVTATPQDRLRMGIKEGEPSITPDGRIITHGPRSQ